MRQAVNGPDFLCIGAQKAGTTWLWTQLKENPAVWMPPRKEVHYFDRHCPAPNYLAEPSVLKRVFGQAEPQRAWRAMLRADFAESFRRRDWASARWQKRFYFGHHDDAWYCSLFPRRRGIITGEFTPAYSILPEEDVAHIAHLLPSLKAILLLRNPIDRAWSQVRFDWTRGARSSLSNLDDVKRFIDSPKQERRSSYLRMLDVWGRYIPRERLFVSFYEDVVRRPAELLDDVCRFLGIRPVPRTTEALNRKVHVSREAPMPPEIHAYLAAKYLPEMKELQARVGGPVQEWIAMAQEALDGGSESKPTRAMQPVATGRESLADRV